MWEISNSTQWLTFLYAVFLGMSFCVLYDLFRLDRMVFKRSVLTVVLEDVVFWTICGFVTFGYLLLMTKGQIRGYVLLSQLFGFVLFRLTLSRFIDLLRNPLKKLCKIIRSLYSRAIAKLAKTDVFLAYFCKKIRNKLHKRAVRTKKIKKKPKNL